MVAILPKIVIAGGGIIGNSIAYYLAKHHQIPVTLIDPIGIAPAASAKAGGFLARDWRDGSPLQHLHQLGFDLHQELANDLGSSVIDYRRLTCAAVSIFEDDGRGVGKPVGKKLEGVEWVDRSVVGSVAMGDEETIAQVHPRKLCDAMWNYSSNQGGSTLHIGKVVKAILDESSTNNSSIIQGVELDDGTILPADKLIVACGPWTEHARSWFPPHLHKTLPPITAVKCHSILVPSPTIFQQAVFFESEGALGDGDLEVYPRPDGDCYVNGFQGEETIIDELPGDEAIEPAAIQLLQKAMELTSSELGGLEPHTKQVCYWPETPDGLPLMGVLDGVEGGFVATGHSVWGICQGPATGVAMAELVVEGEARSVDLSPFRVGRFGGGSE